MTQVAIGCPVRDRAWVLPAYLSALAAIDHPDRQYLFLENNSADATPALLRAWAPGASVRVRTVRTTNPPGHQRGEYGRGRYEHLAGLRNLLAEMVLETDAEYLLSVDSDVIVPSDILRKLLPQADQRTIVGAAICNIAGRELDGRLPGNFLVEQCGLYLHPPTYPLTGTMEVAVTGACSLIPRAVLEAGVRYTPHPQGEDVGFCIAARAAEFRIVVDLDCKPEHRMVET